MIDQTEVQMEESPFITTKGVSAEDCVVGHRYMAQRLDDPQRHLVEVVGPVHELSGGGENYDRILVKDLEDYFDDSEELDCAGGNITFLYNLHGWTFYEVPLTELVEEYLKESISFLGDDAVEDLWHPSVLKDFIGEEAGAFMFLGFLIGKGYTKEDLNTHLPDSEAVIRLIDTFTF